MLQYLINLLTPIFEGSLSNCATVTNFVVM